MGLRDVMKRGKGMDTRLFLPRELMNTVKKEPGTYRARLFSDPTTKDGFPGIVLGAHWWDADGKRKKGYCTGNPENCVGCRKQATLMSKGDVDGANDVAAKPEYWFNAVDPKHPTVMRVLVLSVSQFYKMATAIQIAGGGAFTDYVESDDFDAFFEAGLKKCMGANGRDILIVHNDTEDKKKKYGFGLSPEGTSEALPLKDDQAFDLRAVAMEEESR